MVDNEWIERSIFLDREEPLQNKGFWGLFRVIAIIVNFGACSVVVVNFRIEKMGVLP